MILSPVYSSPAPVDVPVENEIILSLLA